MPAADQTLDAGKSWLLARLERGAHPLDGLDPDAARRTIDALTGLDPEPWTAAWGGLADDFAARAQAATDRSEQRDLWFQAYRAAFMGRYPVPNHPLKQREYDRAREFFLNATTLEDPPLEVVELPFEDSRLRFYLTRPAAGDARPPVAMVWAGIDTWKEEMHVRLGSADALARVRGAARRYARGRRVAGARGARRRAPVDPDLRLARDARRSRRRPLRRDRRLVRRLLGDEARLHPPRPARAARSTGAAACTSRSRPSGSRSRATPPRT